MRDYFGAIMNPPAWVDKLLAEVESAGAWRTGIESDRKRRGSAINTAVYAHDETQGLAVVQVRECVFRPGRWNQVRKNYFLIGRNENGRAFAHPIDVRATGRLVARDPTVGVRLALTKIWGCTERQLGQIVRNGDVAFVPARLPAESVPIAENEIVLADSHHLLGENLSRAGNEIYAHAPASILHAKGQHPLAHVAEGTWRVVVGRRAAVWGFSAPTAD